MSIERQTLMNTQAIRGMMGLLIGKLDALGVAPTPTVDFAVDMFDRQDQDTLGSYWSGNDFAVRSSQAVGKNGSAAASAVAYATAASAAAYANILAYGIANALMESVYQANLTSPDFTCQAPFFAAPTGWNVVAVTPDPDNYVTVDNVVVNGFNVPKDIASAGGVCIANENNEAEGFGAASYRAPALFTYQYTATSSLTEISAAKVRYGSSVLSNAVLEDDLRGTPAAPAYCVQYAATYSAININVINSTGISCAGDLVTMGLGPLTVFSGTPAVVSKKSRKRAGIMVHAANLVAAKVAVPTANLGGITSFKVWCNDIPEPPNESGHGTYVNGRWQYADKYHTPNTDAEGNIIRNEDGTVASYTYDPEA